MTKPMIAPGDYAGLHKELISLVESARRTAARNVNAVTAAAYWEIGRRNHGNGARLHGVKHPFYVAVVGLCAGVQI
jgi:hypothetical protein